MIRKVMINAGLFKITRPIETKPVDPEPLEAELDFTSSEEEKEIIPTPSPTVPVTPETPLAYCDKCKAWHPMKWLPQAERGKRAEEWFMVCRLRGKIAHLALFVAWRGTGKESPGKDGAGRRKACLSFQTPYSGAKAQRVLPTALSIEGRRKDSGYAKKLVAKREKMVIFPQAKENPHSRPG